MVRRSRTELTFLEIFFTGIMIVGYKETKTDEMKRNCFSHR